jgi:hypothetical protein
MSHPPDRSQVAQVGNFSIGLDLANNPRDFSAVSVVGPDGLQIVSVTKKSCVTGEHNE